MSAHDYTNETVLITGASSGFGAEFARQLAARGASLVLVARREDRLVALAAELIERHGTVATVVPFDLSEPDAGPRLLAATAHLNVTSLVNNAGFGGHGAFTDADHDSLLGQVRLNVEALVSVTHAFLPQLRGILINVASIASYQPVPYMAVYGATKAFVRSFTEALWFEAKGTSLKVIALSPGSTKTEFFDVIGSEVAIGGYRLEATEVVTAALKALDRRSPRPGIMPGFVDRVLAFSTRLLPQRAVVSMTGMLMKGQQQRADAAVSQALEG